ncbi:MAG: diacylglycerol kinase family protein [Chloroflexota bacterium]
MSNYTIIVNPISGRGYAGRIISELELELQKHDLNYELISTERPWHAAELAEQAARNGSDVVVAVSGDGTANEVLNGLMIAQKAGHTKTRMGIIAVGTGNDFAYGMGIPVGVQEGCRILAENHHRKVDVGIVFGGDYPDGRFFGNGVGIGFDAATGFVAAKIRWIRGLLLYLIAAIETIFIYYKAPTVRLVYDEKDITQAALMISVMNGQRMGGGFFFAPDGDPTDGFFNLCIADSVSRSRILSLIPYFLKGTQATQKEVRIGQARKVTVKAIQGTLPVHCDGETVCYEGHDLTIELHPQALEFISRKPGQ